MRITALARLAVLLVVMGVPCAAQNAPTTSTPPNQPKATKTRELDLQDVFAWRIVFGDLLSKSRDAVIERYFFGFVH